MILCQSCLKKLENRFEEDRQLCHKCHVIAEAEWDEAFGKNSKSTFSLKIAKKVEEMFKEQKSQEQT